MLGVRTTKDENYPFSYILLYYIIYNFQWKLDATH